MSATAEQVDVLKWTPHPLLPELSAEQIRNAALRVGGLDMVADYYQKREQLIRLSEEDPYNYGTEPEHWKDADELLQLAIIIMVIFGGNRAGKSEYAAKRLVQDAVRFAKTVQFCLDENETKSIAWQQKLIWKYMPRELRELNGKQHPVYKIKYSIANGFTDRKLVLPNESEIYFLTYHQRPGDFEGLELGSKQAPAIGGWADENMTLPWLNMLKLRLASRSGKLLWTFTPVNGMTPTIKELVGAAKTMKSRFAELLADRINIPGLPVGHMPYTQTPNETTRVIYFHSILNPFGNHYGNIKALCAGKPSEYIERRAYGYSRDVAQRAFPAFGAWNVVAPENLPETGTNYFFTDPAGARNWAAIWVRVTPGNPPKFYIYRDWPSGQRYGEWAVPTEREISEDSRKGWDGDPGPAQNSLGYGIVQYKQEFLKQETVRLEIVNGEPCLTEKDPYRRKLQAGLTISESYRTGTTTVGVSATTTEWIRERYIDPRAGKNQHAAERGGTCLVEELAREQRNPRSLAIEGPMMIFRLASGVDKEEGVTAVNTLLFWNHEEPMIPEFNEPHLFVSSDCQQVIWAMQNYTGLGGETGACKDFIDLVRYMALARLRHVEPGDVVTAGGGSY